MVRDKTTLRYGDLICTFMKTLGQSNLVIVVLNAKVPALDLLHDRAARPFTRLGEEDLTLRRCCSIALNSLSQCSA